MIELVYPADAQENLLLGKWVAQRIPGFQPRDFRTMAFFEAGRGILAVVLYHNYRVTDIEVVFAAEPGTRWARRDLIEIAIGYPFRVGCNRVTAICRKDNKAARDFVQRLGFRQEGKLRKADTDGSDMFIYGLLPQDFKLQRSQKLAEAA